MKVPKVCPLCEQEGTVEFLTETRHWRGAEYEYVVCRCTGCGEVFIPAWLMRENLRRAVEAFEHK